MQTQVTLTKHYTDSGTNDRGSWTRNDFVAEDGTTRFKTFDGDVASKAKALLGVPCVVTYDLKERGQYVDNILKDIAPAPGVTQQDVTQAQAQTAAATTERGEREKAKQEVINRSAGLARAIEFCSVSGESVALAFDNGSLFELANTFARFIETGEFSAASPSSVDAATEGASS